MCGIIGAFSKQSNWNVENISKGLISLKHRGPDSQSYTRINNGFLAHVRLSIIDLEGGRQPMPSGVNLLTYNGEIYNYRQLRSELIQKGYRFRTQSDTEVLLSAYEEWGNDCVHYLRGMFAFAIYNGKKHEVFIARDPLGIKPLFFHHNSENFLFASEIQSLKALGLQTSTNWSALPFYLRLGYIPAPKTFYNEIQKVEPGERLICNVQSFKLIKEKYYQFNFAPEDTPISQEEIAASIKESVDAHLVSDVPFGAFLSGGIDSSVVVKYMSNSMSQPVKTFNIGFSHNDKDESPYAEKVAIQYKTNHFRKEVQMQDANILPQLASHFGEPFADSSCIPSYFVSQITAKEVKMVLSGDGADELFGGYERYSKFLEFNKFPLAKWKNIKSHLYPLAHKYKPFFTPNRKLYQKSSISSYLGFIELFSPHVISLMLKNKDVSLEEMKDWESDLNKKTQNLSPLKTARWFDINFYLPFDILPKVDITSMMNSLESRTPFVDVQLFEKLKNVPDHQLINEQWSRKAPLKQILAQDFGSDFIQRPKQGFAIPWDQWLSQNNTANSFLEEQINHTSFNEIFNSDIINQIEPKAKKFALYFLGGILKDS